MARQQQIPITPQPSDASAAPGVISVTLVTSESKMEAFASPALGLQENLQQSWDERHGRPEVTVHKIPVIWTLSVMTLVCGGFWTAVILLAF
jgi:hypothetical protein